MELRYNTTDDSYLMHYGVMGMKWGVRNADTLRKYEGGKGSKKVHLFNEMKQKRISSRQANKEMRNARKDRARAKRERRILSDDELNKRVNRLEKEKKLKQYTDEDLKPGRTAVKKFMAESGRQIAKGAAIGIGSYAVTVILSGGKFNPVEAAKWIKNPAKKK